MSEIKTPGYKPLADRILVLEEEAETKTKSGIIIPDTAKEKPAKGKVVRLGTGLADKNFQVKEGDIVNYSKYAGSEIELDGQEYRVLRETDILGIFEENE